MSLCMQFGLASFTVQCAQLGLVGLQDPHNLCQHQTQQNHLCGSYAHNKKNCSIAVQFGFMTLAFNLK